MEDKNGEKVSNIKKKSELTAKVNVNVYPINEAIIPTDNSPCIWYNLNDQLIDK